MLARIIMLEYIIGEIQLMQHYICSYCIAIVQEFDGGKTSMNLMNS